jgi:hypothetical protein
MNKTDINFNWGYIRGLLVTLAIGTVLIFGYVKIDNHFTSKEYPDLTFKDSLINERVSSLKTNHAITYVDFGYGGKRTLDWGQNRNYAGDYFSIVSILSIGDIVTKKANSDTIIIRHDDKDYVYVFRHVIEKSN